MEKLKLPKNHYWIISISRSENKGEILHTLADLALKHKNLINGFYGFNIPSNSLKVGTLDALISLSDSLMKQDTFIEAVTKKIARQKLDLLDKETRELVTFDIHLDHRHEVSIEQYVTDFQWEDQLFSKDKSLHELVDIIHTRVLKADEELREKSADYNSTITKIKQIEKKKTGNLLVRDLVDIVPEDEILETEYITTLLVVVSKPDIKKWETTYETMADFVLPRSSKKIHEDSEYALFSVKLFKKSELEFRSSARERRFIIRNIDRNEEEDNVDSLESKKKKMNKNLVRWCDSNFQEVFKLWIHLKCIRCFVESVLRFGITVEFQSAIVLPNPKHITRMRNLLADTFGKSSKELQEDNDGGDEGFYPYVSLDVDLNIKYERE